MNEFLYAIVQGDEAKLEPYPYVYINDDGSYRELSKDEKAYLQERFHPADGGRPYVKNRYWQLTPDGKLSGFLSRKKLMKGLKEGEPPAPKRWWEFWMS